MGIIMFCANCSDCVFTDRNIVGIHEIHITVDTKDVISFKEACIANNIKPIVITFKTNNTNEEQVHLMTSERIKGTSAEAYKRMLQISSMLSNYFTVNRQKIEVGLLENDIDYSKGYFESHLTTHVPKDSYAEFLRVITKIDGILLSENAFKVNEDSYVTLCTIRAFNTNPSDFTEKMNAIRDTISKFFKVEKLIIEFCWYDNNLELDDLWTSK
jgi:hypothetical protein